MFNPPIGESRLHISAIKTGIFAKAIIIMSMTMNPMGVGTNLPCTLPSKLVPITEAISNHSAITMVPYPMYQVTEACRGLRKVKRYWFCIPPRFIMNSAKLFSQKPKLATLGHFTSLDPFRAGIT
ncbi:hypothetical protein L3N51_01364 [Metallosphaera sp. J1]|nr:hypothetical protein [Metallosphaera javensis (ex Hofmann et al. 2022)]